MKKEAEGSMLRGKGKKRLKAFSPSIILASQAQFLLLHAAARLKAQYGRLVQQFPYVSIEC
jgi:hypothetical protein